MTLLNPNHEVSQALDQVDMVRKLCAVLVMKLGGRAEVSVEDLSELSAQFQGDFPTLITYAHESHIELYLVSSSEGMQIAREQGGLPQ
jgi:hypothetical protein